MIFIHYSVIPRILVIRMKRVFWRTETIYKINLTTKFNMLLINEETIRGVLRHLSRRTIIFFPRGTHHSLWPAKPTPLDKVDFTETGGGGGGAELIELWRLFPETLQFYITSWQILVDVTSSDATFKEKISRLTTVPCLV